MSEPSPQLYSKIAQVVTEVSEVAMRGRNEHFGYDYATAEDILKELRAPLANKNVALLPSLTDIEEHPYTTSGGRESIITTAHVDFTFVDGDTGEMFKCSWAGRGDDPADKGLGKAYTNAIKTFLRQAFLLPQGDDPEADSNTDARASERHASRPRRSGGSKPSDKQNELIQNLLKRKNVSLGQLMVMLAELGASDDVQPGWIDELTGGKNGQASALIDRLMNGEIPPNRTLDTPPSDVPNDNPPVHPPAGDTSDVPFSEVA